MIEIIGLVDVEAPAIRWNHDGTMFMTEDFRWYPADGPATVEENGLPEAWLGPDPRLPVVMPTVNKAKLCSVCGGYILPTGKRGRPHTKCHSCR